jgi:Reverse transcriptase (RNA-dependent DNA polymerase)
VLVKSLYGLKQAVHVWNKVLHESLTKNGCKQNETDNCVYSVVTSGGEIVHLLTHVDYILAATSNENFLDELMKNVGQDFELKC